MTATLEGIMVDLLSTPWKLESSQVEIVDGYEAEIVGEKGDNYLIEFHDRDMSVVEAELSKSEFVNHPSLPITHFGLITFKYVGKPGIHVGAWPLKNFWSESLRNQKND